MSEKQSAWRFFGVVAVLNLVFIFITIYLWFEYTDEILVQIFGFLLIIPAIPLWIWAIVAICLYCLLKVAIKVLLDAYHTSIAEILF